jgi:hypothetical protein
MIGRGVRIGCVVRRRWIDLRHWGGHYRRLVSSSGEIIEGSPEVMVSARQVRRAGKAPARRGEFTQKASKRRGRQNPPPLTAIAASVDAQHHDRCSDQQDSGQDEGPPSQEFVESSNGKILQ